jgi:[ribosomal protein S5]-alanine N-acetyltransferase
MSFEDFQKFVKEACFFIVEKINESDHVKVGFVSYYLTRSDYPYLFEIGYRIKANERGKGFATEAVKLLVGYLFSTNKGIERLESITDTENVASQRVLEKNGFKREGRLRKRSQNKMEYRDEWIYGLLREERPS